VGKNASSETEHGSRRAQQNRPDLVVDIVNNFIDD